MALFFKLFILFFMLFICTELSANRYLLVNDTELKPVIENFNRRDSIINPIKDRIRTIKATGSGFGMMILSDGSKLIGQFIEGKINGYGWQYYSNGDKHIGQFKNGYKQGEGVFFKATQTTRGIWDNNQIVQATNDDMKGCRLGDCTDGKGIYIYDDYTMYDGEFRAAAADGYGICYYNEHKNYAGFWNENNFNEEDIFYHDIDEGQNSIVINGDHVTDDNMLKFEDIRLENEIAKAELGKIWAIIVGAAGYTEGMEPLNFPDDDAYLFHSFLKSPEGGAIQDERIRLLIDENATKVNIIKSLSDFSDKASSEDVLIFYFSGHGLPGSFLPIDSDGIKNQLKYKELLSVLKSSKAKSKIIIADACYSGGLTASKGKSNQNLMRSYYEAIHDSEGGLVLFMSSKEGQSSIENGDLRQGIFSHFLIKGLKGAANIDNDNIIRINELFEYVQVNVSFYTNDSQTPMVYGDKSIAHPIGFIREN